MLEEKCMVCADICFVDLDRSVWIWRVSVSYDRTEEKNEFAVFYILGMTRKKMIAVIFSSGAIFAGCVIWNSGTFYIHGLQKLY